MTMKRRIEIGFHPFGTALALVIMIGLTPNTAQAFRPDFPLTVIQAPDSGEFEVIEEHAAGPRQIWCAAAEHGRDVLGLPTATRLYIARGRGPSQLAPGRISVRFSPVPVTAVAPKQDGPYTASLRDVGFSLSIGHAQTYCDNVVDDLSDLF
jgi:hypothetical protein